MTADEALIEVLTDARSIGMLGPGPIEEHLDHARLFIEAIPQAATFFVDLGSGGGVPGLVIAQSRPDLAGALLDGSTKRGAFLHEAIDVLELGDRIIVWTDRAEVVGRDNDRRGCADVVVARSFGPPAVVAECAAPLLKVGGRLVVSDPPSLQTPERRWPAEGVAAVGQRMRQQEAGPPAFTIIEQVELCPNRYPRRVGIPSKRPLF